MFLRGEWSNMPVQFNEVAPNLKITAYLLRDDIGDVLDALSPSSRPGGRDGMIRLQSASSSDLPEGTVAFAAVNRSQRPPWAQALAPDFPELADVHNMSTRMVLFLPVGDRHFAICFGYGGASLRKSTIDPNFGLRYAARTLDQNVIFGLDSRRMSATARSQAVQTVSGERLSDLDIPLAGEFVRRLAGRLEDGASLEIAGITTIVAGDGVSFKTEFVLNEIQSVLGTMLHVVDTDRAKQEFEFVDALESLRATDERVKELETELCAVLNALMVEPSSQEPLLIGLVPPESPNVDLLDTVRVSVGGEHFDLPELSLTSLLDFMRVSGKRFSKTSLSGIKLSILDENGESGSASSLRTWLVYETVEGDQRAILTLGRWFGLNEAFSARLDNDLSQIEVSTGELGLPDWAATLSRERDYNDFVASVRNDLLKLDRTKFLSLGSEIEACDLLTQEGHLVHVKRWDKSATLSHLFSQGLVSLEVLNADPEYLKQVETHLDSRSRPHLDGFRIRPRKVVYAIAMRGARLLPDSLPTFSKVNLRDFAQRVRSRGAEISISRIQME